MQDTTALQVMSSAQVESAAQLSPRLSQVIASIAPEREPSAKAKRGHPLEISWGHLWLSLLTCVLCGMENYQQWWRLVRSEQVGPFAPVKLTDDALIKRLLQAGLEPLQQLLLAVSQQLAEQLAPVVSTTLAPFASAIVALDETTLDAVSRHLAPLRGLPKGDPGLLAGKLALRFNIRSQQWDWVQFRSHVLANCKVDVCAYLEGLQEGSLLLFDLGYFGFAWLDYLTERRYWWISRLREKTKYQLVHIYYRHHEILDALVWLGSEKGSRAGRLVRLVRFGDGKQIRSYLTNVLDPRQLSMGDIARLYARRWDIELAILTLKELLGLHHWWSSKLVLIWQQVLLTLLAAQLLQAIRLQAAAQAGVDPFEISLSLLIQAVPQFIRQRHDPVQWLLAEGRDLGLFRPSSRLHLNVPELDLDLFVFPSPDLKLTRRARYVEYRAGPKLSGAAQRKRKQQRATSPPAQPPPFVQLTLPGI